MELSHAADAERAWLRDFVRWAKGDPNLTAWEEHFLSFCGHVLVDAGDCASPKTAACINSLAERLGYAEDRPVYVPELTDEYLD